MGGITFKAKGTGGASTQTVWLSYAADRYTMLSNYQNIGGTPTLANGNALPTPGLYGKDQVSFNSTFGGFINAPDGTTNTCKKIVEDNTTNLHGVYGCIIQSVILQASYRVAGIFKAAERTRVALMHFIQTSGNVYSYCGFDLSGGQIAYGAQINDNTAITNQTIISLGNGFYLCFADFRRTGSGSGITQGEDFRIVLDNGTGTNAPSISYTGDNSSGLYAWRTSILPPQAWRIGGQVFFDGFDDPTMKNIDIQNSQVEGFDWYVSQPYYDRNTGQGNFLRVAVPPPPSSFAMSQSGSILTIPCQQNPSLGVPGGISSASGTGDGHAPGTPLGKGWRPPFIAECKLGVGNGTATNNGRWSFWSAAIENLNQTLAHTPATDNNINGGEMDFYEEAGLGPSNNAFLWTHKQGIIGISGSQANDPGSLGLNGIQTSLGYSPYLTGVNYNPTQIVASGGNFYQANAPVNTAPPGANWNTFTYTNGNQPTVLADFSQQHVTTHMVVPYDPVTKNRGQQLQWWDGVFCGTIQNWIPSTQLGNGDNNNQFFCGIDWQRWMVMINMNDPPNPAPPNGYDVRIDYVKVSQ